MPGHDSEIERLRTEVSCAVLLETLPPPWRLDRRESTAHCLKYRRGKGEVLIVVHQGRGWRDPGSDRKGDVFSLVQYLEPRLNFGEVRKLLRPLIGLKPNFPETLRDRRRTGRVLSIAESWRLRPRLRPGSRAWRYLAETRRLTPRVLARAAASDIVREGPYGSAWFAHRDEPDRVSHIEIRGPDFRGSLRGGTKVLFRLQGSPEPSRRLAIAEAPINALSLAAVEQIRTDTLYLATGGGMGPATLRAIEVLLAALAPLPDACCCSATDDDAASERYATRHRALAEAAGVPFERLLPPIAGGDWNDALKQGRGCEHDRSRFSLDGWSTHVDPL